MSQRRLRKIHKIDLPSIDLQDSYNVNLSNRIQEIINSYIEDMNDLETDIDDFEQALYDGNVDRIDMFKDAIQADLDAIKAILNHHKQKIIEEVKIKGE